MMRLTLILLWLATQFCAVATPRAEDLLASLPVTFEQNQGQWPPGVEFGAHIGGHRYAFSGREIVIDGAIHIDVVSSINGKLEALESVKTKTNYLTSANSSARMTGVPNYSRIRRRNAFPGIDLILYGSHGQLEFDYLVAPGANPDRIRMRVRGASIESLSGNIRVKTGSNPVLELHAPVAYQEMPAGRRTVDCRYGLLRGQQITIAIAPYDRTSPLVIDPTLTDFATISGTIGSGSGRYPIVTDAAGDFYLAGNTTPYVIPTTPGTLRTKTTCAPPYVPICIDTWVMKFSPRDNQIIWGTYFGVTPNTRINTIGLDPSGNVVLGGYTSPDFPVTPDAYLTKPPGMYGGGFLSKLDPNGASLVYSTFLDGEPIVMKIDSQGTIYFSDGPTIEKFNASVSTMLYSISTPGNVSGIAIDETGNLYALSGASPEVPVTPGSYRSSDSDSVYILKFDPQGSMLFAASFNASIPASLYPAIAGTLALDPSGNIVFTGMAGSGFPVTNDPDPQPNDCDPSNPCMAYVAALSNDGTTLQYARVLGHGRGDRLAFGANGDVYVAGAAYGGYFPRTFDAFEYCNETPPSVPTNLPAPSNAPNGFVMRLDAQGQRVFSSYLGTAQTFIGYLQFTVQGDLYIAGYEAGPTVTGWGYFVGIINTTQSPPIPHACLVNATQNVADSDGGYRYVAPGQMVAMSGEGLGPQDPATAQWNANGSLSNNLAGVQVLFDGIPAPILYAQANQVNCIVPFGVASKQTTSVVVQNAGNQTDPLMFHVAPAVANPFTKDYLPGSDVIAINMDGTLNSAEHPAPRGSIVTFFATGLGQTDPPLQDGQIATGAAAVKGGIYVVFFNSKGYLDTEPADILYQGAVPGQIAGFYQLNVRIPADAHTGHTRVQFDSVGILTEGIWLQ